MPLRWEEPRKGRGRAHDDPRRAHQDRCGALQAALRACCDRDRRVLAGCGRSSSHTPTSGELALERTQLVLVSSGLRALEAPVRREVAASRGCVAADRRRAPANAVGLPARRGGTLPARPHARSPNRRSWQQSSKLTGPAAGIAGLYESFSRLA